MSVRGYACIGLDNPKDPLNVGSVMRAAGCYGAAMVAVAGPRAERSVSNVATDTQKAYRHIPTIRTADLFELIPYDCVPVAVDLLPDAKPLPEYRHPERAFYIFGAEDATLSARVTARCADAIYIPTRHCMNLAATVNVVLYDRAFKLGFGRRE